MNAGEPGCGQEVGETALCLAGFKRNTVEQQLVLRNAKQKGSIPLFGKTLLQFVPGDLELPGGPLVLNTVQSDILHQDVQTVNEGADGRGPVTLTCICRENTRRVEMRVYRLSV